MIKVCASLPQLVNVVVLYFWLVNFFPYLKKNIMTINRKSRTMIYQVKKWLNLVWKAVSIPIYLVLGLTILLWCLSIYHIMDNILYLFIFESSIINYIFIIRYNNCSSNLIIAHYKWWHTNIFPLQLAK